MIFGMNSMIQVFETFSTKDNKSKDFFIFELNIFWIDFKIFNLLNSFIIYFVFADKKRISNFSIVLLIILVFPIIIHLDICFEKNNFGSFRMILKIEFWMTGIILQYSKVKNKMSNKFDFLIKEVMMQSSKVVNYFRS